MLMMGLWISFIAMVTASFLEYFPVFNSRETFSTTTMASSTTIAMASTNPNNVNRLMENPNSFIMAKVPISEMGIVIVGIITARKF